MARERHSMVKATVFITLIITMNLLGISYGHWQDGLTSEMRVSTGNMKPYFCNKVKVKKAGDLMKSKATLKIDKDTEDEFVKLTGVIESGKSGKLTLEYTVVNNGSAPIEFDHEAFEEINKQLLNQESDGLRIIKNKPSNKVLYPKNYSSSDKESKGSLTLQIDAPLEAGDYTFEVKIPYKQWTGK